MTWRDFHNSTKQAGVIHQTSTHFQNRETEQQQRRYLQYQPQSINDETKEANN